MNKSRLIKMSLTTLALLHTSACVDVDSIGQGQDNISQRKQAVVVTPEFSLEGAELLPDHLFLTQMGLLVSEVRLTPLVSNASGVAYSTAEAMPLTFDVSKGEFTQIGRSVTIPSPGRYVVSIRLEPLVAHNQELGSLSVEGFIAEAVDVANPTQTSDGTPLPLPFDERPTDADQLGDAAGSPVVWTPFSYNSKRTVFYTMNQVELVPGNQKLEFSFNLQDWASGAVEPISNAIKNNPSANAEGGVDVTRQIESIGQGVDAMVQTGVVRIDELPSIP
jgi:hypothetical protein